MNDLKNRLSELDELLKYISPEDWAKIPDDVIFYIKDNKNDDYVWQYDESKSIEEQNVNPDTFFILLYIMCKYVFSDEERKQFEGLIRENTKKII